MGEWMSAATAWWATVSAVEAWGVLFGLLCVWLTVRENIWCWPTGIVNIVLFFILFLEARLYAELVTYSVFFVLSVYGWWAWLRGGQDHSALVVTRTPRRLGLIVISVAGSYGLAQALVLVRFTDAALPFWDSAITAASLAAQWMMAKKYLESWLVWIGVDVVAIGVYASRDLWLTSGLYAVYLGLAVAGYLAWRRAARVG
jgi:nicotinamide mononucleotide transporter